MSSVKPRKMHDVLLELRASHKRPAPLLAEGKAAGLQPMQGLTSGHPAHLVNARQFLL